MKVIRQKSHTLNIDKKVSEHTKYLIFTGIAGYFIILSFIFNTPQEIFNGQIKILLSPANLFTDYFALTDAGVTFFNSGLMILHAMAIIRIVHAKINGPIIAAVLTIAGFSFFGKNLYNSMPIVIGAFLYAKVTHVPAKNSLLAALFGTALGPLVSEISFNIGLSIPIGIGAGWVSGIIAGFLIPPLSDSFIKFTKGFSLYNIGFTSGIIGTVFSSLLRGFGVDIEPVILLSSGNNIPAKIILFTLFLALLLIGLFLNGWTFRGYKNLIKETGQLSTDFVDISGFSISLINVSILGLLGIGYALVLGGDLNGPVIGGILTLAGFGSFGKHPKNVIPISIGVTGLGLISSYDISSTSVITVGLFGTTLAPLAGHYGNKVGIIAGALHLLVVMNTSFLHGGVNLYNNGFAGGLVAATLVPLLEAIKYHKEKQRQWKNPVNPADEVEVD